MEGEEEEEGSKLPARKALVVIPTACAIITPRGGFSEMENDILNSFEIGQF